MLSNGVHFVEPWKKGWTQLKAPSILKLLTIHYMQLLFILLRNPFRRPMGQSLFMISVIPFSKCSTKGLTAGSSRPTEHGVATRHYHNCTSRAHTEKQRPRPQGKSFPAFFYNMDSKFCAQIRILKYEIRILKYEFRLPTMNESRNCLACDASSSCWRFLIRM